VDPRIGTEFAGHRIERVVGRGGVSVVYLAEHLRLGRKVALKVLAQHLAEDGAFRERFIRESRMAATLDHPNIVTVYDAGEVDDCLYISMRYVEGSDLSKILSSEGALHPARAILLLSHVATALDAAHAHGLVHRDVKPANMLVENTADRLERAFLSDFGISKRTTTGSGLTRTGQFVGTVDYVAPEQISGEPIDGRTDVYSLGCVLFQCVAGRVPFAGETEIATVYRQLNDAPPSLEGYLDEPDVMDAVIAKAMAKSKEERYPTCGSLIEAARVSLAGQKNAPTVVRPVMRSVETSVSEPPTEVIATSPRRPRRRPARWGSIGVAALALIVLAAAVLANNGAEREPPRGPGPGSTAGSGTTTTAPRPAQLQIAWGLLKDPQPLTGDQVVSDVVAVRDPPGSRHRTLVAVGHVNGEGGLDDSAVWYSSQTTQWDQWNPSPSPSLTGPLDQRLLAVAVSGDRLIAGGWQGNDAAVWFSKDAGVTWSLSAADLGPGVVRDFTHLGSTLVAVGAAGSAFDASVQDAAVWTSDDDGRTWALMSDADLTGPGGQHIWSVETFDGGLVAVGHEYGTDLTYDAAVWTSPDGTDWSRVDPATFDEPGNQVITGIAGGIDGVPLVAVGCEDDVDRCGIEGKDSDAAVWASDDGERWTKVELAGQTLVGTGVQTMYAVSLSGAVFVAVGTQTGNGNLDGAVWTSSDGRAWSLQRAPGFVRVLGGDPDDQVIRALIPFRRKTLSFVAVGVADNGSDQDAVIWGGSVITQA
jgi:serine/threonine-protein kinase